MCNSLMIAIHCKCPFAAHHAVIDTSETIVLEPPNLDLCRIVSAIC